MAQEGQIRGGRGGRWNPPGGVPGLLTSGAWMGFGQTWNHLEGNAKFTRVGRHIFPRPTAGSESPKAKKHCSRLHSGDREPRTENRGHLREVRQGSQRGTAAGRAGQPWADTDRHLGASSRRSRPSWTPALSVGWVPVNLPDGLL